MFNNILHQYMKHLRVNLLEGDYGMVYSGWNEVNRKLPYNKLYFFESGEGLITLDGIKYNPSPNELLFIPEGTIQSLQIVSPKRYVKYWCHFKADIGTTPIRNLINFPIYVKVNDVQVFQDMFNNMLQAHNSNAPFSPLKANGALLELLHYFFTVIVKQQVTINKNSICSKTTKILLFMENHINEKLKIQDIANAMNLHPNYLIRLFKTTFGTSPMDYFIKLKINKAQEMLELTDAPINEISNFLGFSSPYYFSKVFKNYTSYTPKDYRKQYHQKLR